MILPFSEYFDKKKEHDTYFAEKINMLFADKQDEHKEFYEKLLNEQNNFMFFLCHRLNYNSEREKPLSPKIHTIRTDGKNRWKVGNKIHCVYNNRSKNQFQFAPTFECVSVQEIKICWLGGNTSCLVSIDGKPAMNKLAALAKNDGFNSVEEFLAYFNTDFEGKIIHFTDLKY